jgi:hypothetical protein
VQLLLLSGQPAWLPNKQPPSVAHDNQRQHAQQQKRVALHAHEQIYAAVDTITFLPVLEVGQRMVSSTRSPFRVEIPHHSATQLNHVKVQCHVTLAVAAEAGSGIRCDAHSQ